MDFIDLKSQQQRIREKIEERIRKVLDHGQYIMGPEVQELEERLAAFVGVSRAIACSSGTDALLLALMAWGVKAGDAVFTTPFTFVATAEVIALLGATPVFVDVDPQTFNMDPQSLEAAVRAVEEGDEKRHPLPKFGGLSPGTGSSLKPFSSLTPKGIIAVDLFGLPADYREINDLAEAHGLFVLEDGAQSFGAEYQNKKSCALAEIACTSFFPAKPLGGYGDGGMCFTDDARLAEVMRSLRNHGQGRDRYENVRVGINGRLDTFQAAILLVKLELFPEEIALRREVAERYQRLLSPLQQDLRGQFIPPDRRSVWSQFSLLAKDGRQRQRILKALEEADIPTAVYYPRPLHLQTAFSGLGYQKGQFPHSEALAERIFSLPMHPYLKAEDQERIVEVLRQTLT